MNPTLRNLLVGGIAVTVAGVAATFWTPIPSATKAQMVAAGITTDFNAKRVACSVLGPLPDGGEGYRELRTVVAVSKTLNADGRRDVIWPRNAAQKIRRHLRDENAQCRVLGNVAWQDVADLEAEPDDSPGSCACRDYLDAGNCRLASDGGIPPLENEMQPGEFVGSDCVPRVCGEVFGSPNRPARCFAPTGAP